MDRKWVQLLILSIFLASASCLRLPRRANYASGVAPMNFERKDDSKSTDTQYNYTIKGEKEEIPCILANMNVTMIIPYNTVEHEAEHVTVAIPEEAKASGVCGGVVSTMSLKWGPEDKNNTVTFTFVNDHAKFSVLQIVVDIFVAATGERLKKSSKIDLHLFAAPVENGLHSCKELSEVQVGDIMLNFKDVSLIAFNKEKDTSKRTSVSCPKESNDKSFPYALRNSKDDSPCVLAKMKISLRVPYKTKFGKTSTRILNVPETAKVSGNCDSESVFPQMMLSWKVAEENVTKSVDVENNITLVFSRFSRSTFLQGAMVDVFLDEENFPDAMYPNSKQTEITKFDVSPTENEAGIYNCPKGFADNIQNISMSVTDILIIYNDESSSFLLLSEVECPFVGITSESFIYKLQHPKTNIPCILANMTASMEVPYKTESNEKTGTLEIPADAYVSGTCGQYVSYIELSWTEKSEKDAEETNKVTFYLWNDLEKFYVYQVTFDIYYDSKNFPNAIDKGVLDSTKTDLILFDAPVGEGLYKCKDQPQKLEGHTITLTIQDVALIAFNDNENFLFRQVKECGEDENNPDTSSTSESTTTPSSTSETTSSSESTTTPSSTSETTSSSESTTTPSSTSETTSAETPEPKPAPSGNEYMYIVSDRETEVPCILANMSISLKIPYEKKDSKSAEVILKVPAKADVSGICGIVESNMVVSWAAESKDESRSDKKDNELTFTFLKDSSDFYLYSVRMKIQLDETHFPDAANATFEDASTEELKLFSAPVNTGLYKCDPETVVDAKKAVMTVTDVVLIAFNTDKTLSPKSETNCVAGADVGAIVGGIIGGLILLGVIIMAVVMYRRRRGY